jgi:hypothetical protein
VVRFTIVKKRGKTTGTTYYMNLWNRHLSIQHKLHWTTYLGICLYKDVVCLDTSIFQIPTGIRHVKQKHLKHKRKTRPSFVDIYLITEGSICYVGQVLLQAQKAEAGPADAWGGSIVC